VVGEDEELGTEDCQKKAERAFWGLNDSSGEQMDLIFRVLERVRVTKPDPKLNVNLKLGSRVRIYTKLRECPGRMHDWVMSSVGIIRKPKGYMVRR